MCARSLNWLLLGISCLLLSAQKCGSLQESTAWNEEPEAVAVSDSISQEVAEEDTIAPLPFSYVFLSEGDELIEHPGFMLVYSEAHEQAFWVGYELTKERTEGPFERTDRFLEDPKVSTGSAKNADYSGSGYDRGHLAPAADLAWSEESMKASFYFSNMSPQLPGFNRGVWKRLEELVRDWAKSHDHIYIVTGPVLNTTDLPTIGENAVAVPRYYYKVIIDYTEPEWAGIGFVLENASSSLPLHNFAVSIDSVQRLTGLDFFQFLPDTTETRLEAENCFSCW
jgi:endonuclease G, mitochondrial